MNHINKTSKDQKFYPQALSSKTLILKNTLVICSAMCFIGCLFLLRFLNKYECLALPNIRIYDISSRIISSIHSFLTAFFAGLYLKKRISFVTWYKLLSVSIGYFIFDIAGHFFFDTISFGTIAEPCIHHTVVMLVIVSYLDKYDKESALGFLAEFTTPILYTSWWLYKGGYTNTILFKLSAICLLIGFGWLRVYNFTRRLWQLYKKKATTFELVSFSSLVAMNYYWFIRLLHKWIVT